MAVRFKNQVFILVLLLALPGCVYIFLQLFGTNKFGLKTYYPVKIQKDTVNNNIVSDTTFYTLPDFSYPCMPGYTITSEDLEGVIHIAAFVDIPFRSNMEIKLRNQLRRIDNFFGGVEEVRVVYYLPAPDFTDNFLKRAARVLRTQDHSNFIVAGMNQKALRELGEHTYRLKEQTKAGKNWLNRKLVLVDRQKRIRGYYDATKSKEVERLITELNIILH